MTGVSFTVPGEPIGKGRPRATTRAGHAALYTPKKTANYESLIAHAAHQKVASSGSSPCNG